MISNTSPRENLPELWDIVNSGIAKVIGNKVVGLENFTTGEIELNRKICRRLQMELIYLSKLFICL